MFRSPWVVVVIASCWAAACGSNAAPTAPSGSALRNSVQSSAAGGTNAADRAEQPPFNLEAVLRGDGFGLVTFRQQRDRGANVVNLGVWIKDLAPLTSYSLQRAVDTTLDGVCTGTDWLTLGLGPAAYPLVTDEDGAARADLWRDLSALSPGTAFDIDFRVVRTGTNDVALQSGCYRFVVRD